MLQPGTFTRIPPHVLREFDISPFLDMLLSMAQERTVEGLLQLSTRVYKGTHVACGCVWFAEDTPQAEDEAGWVLRLMTVAGRTRQNPRDWRHAAGTFALVPASEPLIGAVAARGEPIVAPSPHAWKRPDWAISEGYQAYSAFPMICKGELVGLLALFYELPMTDRLGDLLSLHYKMHKIYADSLAVAVTNARAFEEILHLRRELEMENERLRRQVEHGADGGGLSIVGDSSALRRVLAQVDMVAPTDATVLVLGESGTGKELVAEAIHRRSQRSTGPLVRVNCSAIPRELFESEFFGHVKGAFTGAVRDRIGRFQLADGGTLFLDEVGEIPPELQGKLLRVLQEGTFERVGEDRTRTANVRIIAATNRDLRAEVEAGRFRQDLFFRLSVFPVELPPLRERPDDIPLLARHFIASASSRLGLPAPRLTPAALSRLQSYPWPGNVREMQNIIERAVIMSADGTLGMDALPVTGEYRTGKTEKGNELGTGGAPLQPGETSAVVITEEQWRDMQRANITRALTEASGRIHGAGGAAELLGIPPTTLRSRIQSLGVRFTPPGRTERA